MPDDELPDPSLFWRWVGRATRPVVGWALGAIGAIAILIGWIGVSGESVVAKQLPYLISGGIGGVALVGAGAALIATEDLRRYRDRLDRLESMVEDLHSVLLAGPDAPASPNGQQQATRDGLVALPTASVFHRPDCSMVAGKDKATSVTASAIRSRGLEPCRLCEPASV
jgi:hypothetical protein